MSKFTLPTTLFKRLLTFLKFTFWGGEPEMSRTTLWIRVAVVLVGSTILALRIHPSAQRVFQSPDTALALVAVCISIALWTQTVAKLRGISYYPRNNSVRSKFINLQPVAKEGYLMVIGKVHWISLILIVFFGVSLLIGTIRDIANYEEEVTKHDIQDIKVMILDIQKQNQDLFKSNQELIQQMRQDNLLLIDSINKVLEQNTEILKRLEAQNVNTTNQ